MTRSLLQPIRTRRVLRSPLQAPSDADDVSLTPGTRKTLAAIGALWVSFAVSSASGASTRPATVPARAPAPELLTR